MLLHSSSTPTASHTTVVPPFTMPAKRMTANHVQAPRHRPGKPLADSDSSEKEESEDDTPSSPTQPDDVPSTTTKSTGIASNLCHIDLAERQRKATAGEVVRVETQGASAEDEFVTESEEESGESSDSIESGPEESSSDESPRRLQLRPTFIKRDQRKNGASTNIEPHIENQKLHAEEARRKMLANEMVEEQIRKDLAAKLAGKKNWDDEEEDDDIDDLDGIDPEAEYAAWKLRELTRIKREREEIEQRELELDEVQRRKNLTAEERKAEDDRHISKQREEKEGKAKMSYMQKYYHKGAFYHDDAKAEGLDQREIMGAKIQDEYDRELLPQFLQRRDMTKIGKKGATKYRDLKTEDTGSWGQYDYKAHRGKKDDYNSGQRYHSDWQNSADASGANIVPVGNRREAAAVTNRSNTKVEASQSNAQRHQSGRLRSRSASRSPRRESRRDDNSRRRRSTSRSNNFHDREKRRRVDR